MVRMPLPANTSSNADVNLLSRSRIKNLNRPGAVRTGGPGLVCRAGTSCVTRALVRSVPCHARDAPGLAPQAGREEVRHKRAAQARPPSGHPE